MEWEEEADGMKIDLEWISWECLEFENKFMNIERTGIAREESRRPLQTDTDLLHRHHMTHKKEKVRWSGLLC